MNKAATPKPSRPTPPPHSFLDLSAEELKQMLCEEEKNVNATARSFSSDAERMTALQTGDAGLSGEVPNLQDGVISSPLGRSSHEDDGPNLGHVAALDDVAQSTSDGSSGQNIVEPKRLRNAADGCSWENKRSKNGSSTSQGKSQKPAATSPLGPSSDGDASAKPEHPGNKRSPKNYFSGFSGKIRGGLIIWILVGIMLIITPRGYSNLPVNLSKAFASYSNIRIYENWFSEESANLDIQGNRNPYGTTGSIDVNSCPSSNQNDQVATPADGNESSDKNDELPNKSQDTEGVRTPTWLRWMLAVLLTVGTIIYCALNNFLLSPSNPISIIDAFDMTLKMSGAIWALWNVPQYMHSMFKHVFR